MGHLHIAMSRVLSMYKPQLESTSGCTTLIFAGHFRISMSCRYTVVETLELTMFFSMVYDSAVLIIIFIKMSCSQIILIVYCHCVTCSFPVVEVSV